MQIQLHINNFLKFSWQDLTPQQESAGTVSGSRFSQWFNAAANSGGNSQSNSRRSSINEEFSYLAGWWTISVQFLIGNKLVQEMLTVTWYLGNTE